MQALLEFILKQAKALWPLVVVREWQIALLIRRGIIVRHLPPGLHWRWLFLDEVITYAGTECALDLGTAAITTADGEAVAISANLGYRMVDMARNYRVLWNTEKSLGTLALGAVASECASVPTTRLLSERRAVEAELLIHLRGLAEQWGLEVVRFHLTDCVKLRAHRHYVDGNLGKVA